MMKGHVDLDPLDEELAAQLGALRWHRDSKGRIVIESKEEMKKRGLPSPDRADAVSMAFSRGDWRPTQVPTLESELAELWRRAAEAQAFKSSHEGRIAETFAPQLTDQGLLEDPM
jgi:hypothetical protein